MPRLVYLVSEDWYFISHRLPMARAARSAGFDVHVATRVVDYGPQIQREGFALHPIDWRRGSINPLQAAKTIASVRALYRKLKPDIVHHVAFVPAVIGSLAALGLPGTKINALTGLGFVFTSSATKAKLLRFFAQRLLRFLLTRRRAITLVQNRDDQAMVEALGIPTGKITRIPGSGVDTDLLVPLPEPPEPFTVGFVGRLLYDKGAAVVVEAHELLRKRGLPVRTLMAGAPDPSNPASIPPEMLAQWHGRDGVVLLGHLATIESIWKQAHVAVLPSRREGLPKSLLEAAACGRAMIATDVPGCREIVRPGVNGLLVPVDNAEALANAIERLMNDPQQRLQFGKAARQIVEDEYSGALVGRSTVALYNRLLEKKG